jgi:hypothetical protein
MGYQDSTQFIVIAFVFISGITLLSLFLCYVEQIFFTQINDSELESHHDIVVQSRRLMMKD